jgi:hypothetical protein
MGGNATGASFVVDEDSFGRRGVWCGLLPAHCFNWSIPSKLLSGPHLLTVHLLSAQLQSLIQSLASQCNTIIIVRHRIRSCHALIFATPLARCSHLGPSLPLKPTESMPSEKGASLLAGICRVAAFLYTNWKPTHKWEPLEHA